MAPRLRSCTEVSHNSITIPSFLGNRLEGGGRGLRIVSGVVILVFFALCVSSGMVAVGLFLQSSFGSTYHAGMLLVAGVTILYTFFGGFPGATYTDVAQGLLVLAAIMSTVSSQLVVSSSALVGDRYELTARDGLSPRRQAWPGRAGVDLAAVVAAARPARRISTRSWRGSCGSPRRSGAAASAPGRPSARAAAR